MLTQDGGKSWTDIKSSVDHTKNAASHFEIEIPTTAEDQVEAYDDWMKNQ